MHDNVEQIRSLIASILQPKLQSQGRSLPNLSDDFDLRDEGIVDSLGFVELIAELETRMGGEIDLTDLDAESLTNVGALARHIAQAKFSS